GISRPTFRQAARLLEYEELLVIRRGAGGGFFGRKPSADVVARMAGIYLLAQGATFEEVIRAQHALERAALQEIAANPDPAVRRRPAEYLAACRDLTRPYDVPNAIRAINRFWQLVNELLANRAVMLFMLASQAYGAKSGRLIFNAARLDIYLASIGELAGAIQAGDAERAVTISAERAEQMAAWSREETA
ncbi:MAG: transcriptional regulator, partial [Phenylobacterium sp.]|nr:transcriptional regulator [Phenylobacterium sp.]